jgi:hypothetical protein
MPTENVGLLKAKLQLQLLERGFVKGEIDCLEPLHEMAGNEPPCNQNQSPFHNPNSLHASSYNWRLRSICSQTGHTSPP